MTAAVFMLFFIATSFLYSFLAAFTTILYRHKSALDLTSAESDILFGRASIFVRFLVLFNNLISSTSHPPCWFIGGAAAVIFRVVTYLIN